MVVIKRTIPQPDQPCDWLKLGLAVKGQLPSGLKPQVTEKLADLIQATHTFDAAGTMIPAPAGRRMGCIGIGFHPFEWGVYMDDTGAVYSAHFDAQDENHATEVKLKRVDPKKYRPWE